MKRDLNKLVAGNKSGSLETRLIPVGVIKESPTQARSEFNSEDIKGLAESIKANGVIQPLVVQIAQDNTYKLIAGERRLRAAKIADLKEIPCIVKDVSKRDAAVMGIVENIQREKLSPIDESQGFKKLVKDHGLNIKEVSNLVGKSRSYVSNAMRLSGLAQEVIDGLRSKKVKVGQVRPLISLSEEKQCEIYKEILILNLSSREVEGRVSSLLSKPSNNNEEILHAQKLFEDYFGMPILVIPKRKGGKIEINFKNMDELFKILNKLK